MDSLYFVLRKNDFFYRPCSIPIPMPMSPADFSWYLLALSLSLSCYVCFGFAVCAPCVFHIFYSSVVYFAFATLQLLYWVDNFLNDVFFFSGSLCVCASVLEKHERMLGVSFVNSHSRGGKKKCSNVVAEKRDNGLVAFSTHSTMEQQHNLRAYIKTLAHLIELYICEQKAWICVASISKSFYWKTRKDSITATTTTTRWTQNTRKILEYHAHQIIIKY